MRLALALLSVMLLLAACGSDDNTTSSPTGCTATPVTTPTTVITFETTSGQQQLTAEVADTVFERGVGLMNRPCLAENAGMIFAWLTDTTETFWMKDTHVPLTIAFIQADGRIVHIEDMQPDTTNSHASPEPYRFAIEVNQGWFAEHGARVGSGVGIPASLSQQAKN